ncbi:nucleotide-binding protein, partial [Plasmodium yoelii yoelii]
YLIKMDSDIIDEEFVYGKNIEKIKKKKELILDCLKEINDPDLKRNIVELNFVRNLKIKENKNGKYDIEFDLNLTTPACPVKDELLSECKKKLNTYDWIEDININITFFSFNENDRKKNIKKIENIILVYSCKGGVGKSFFSVNFAYYLKKQGATVGLLDADINGPSLPTLLPFDHSYAKFKALKKKKKNGINNKIFYEQEKINNIIDQDQNHTFLKKESFQENYFFDKTKNIMKNLNNVNLIDERHDENFKLRENNNNKIYSGLFESYTNEDNENEEKKNDIIDSQKENNDDEKEERGDYKEEEDITIPLIEPLIYKNVKLMSYAYIKDKQKLGFASFRGPILNELISEFVHNVNWGVLDYLIIDMPPGTSDIHLNLFESEHIDGIIMITTPNDLSINDAEKGINMSNYFNIPIICLIINMNYFICDNCDKKHYIFNNCDIKSLQKKISKIYEFPFHPLVSKNVYNNTDFDHVESVDKEKGCKFSDEKDCKFPFILSSENHYLIQKLEEIFENATREISIIKYNHTLNLPSIQIYNKYYIQLSFDSIQNKYVFSDDVLTCNSKDIRLKCACDICTNLKKNNPQKKKNIKKYIFNHNIYVKEIIKLGAYNVKFIWSDDHFDNPFVCSYYSFFNFFSIFFSIFQFFHFFLDI